MKTQQEQIDEIKNRGGDFCELCSRYGAITEATTTRELDSENRSNDKREFPVCAECAVMLDDDTE
jgi:hypothetical protein